MKSALNDLWSKFTSASNTGVTNSTQQLQNEDGNKCGTAAIVPWPSFVTVRKMPIPLKLDCSNSKLILNPANTQELLLFGSNVSYYEHNSIEYPPNGVLYIYNTVNNTLKAVASENARSKKLKQSIISTLFESKSNKSYENLFEQFIYNNGSPNGKLYYLDSLDVMKMDNCNDDKKENRNVFLVIGTIGNTGIKGGCVRDLNRFATYFDAKCLKFVDKYKNSEEISMTTMHSSGKRVLYFKDYLFISAGYTTDENIIDIYRINRIKCRNSDNRDTNDTNDSRNIDKPFVKIGTIELPREKEYNLHGFIIKSSKYCDINITDNDINGGTSEKCVRMINIELLLFGGRLLSFNDSFTIVNVKLPIINNEFNDVILDDRNSVNNNISFEISYPTIAKFNYMFDSIDMDMNNNNKSSSVAHINMNMNDVSSNHRDRIYYDFEYYYVKKRYLLLFGGFASDADKQEYHPINVDNKIVYYDFKCDKWTIVNNCRLDINYKPFYDYQMKTISAYIPQKDKIFIFNFESTSKNDQYYKFYKNILVLNIGNQPLLWNCQRQIWIAFYKNSKNDRCLIDRLPKDVVRNILNLCCWSIFDQINRFTS